MTLNTYKHDQPLRLASQLNVFKTCGNVCKTKEKQKILMHYFIVLNVP